MADTDLGNGTLKPTQADAWFWDTATSMFQLDHYWSPWTDEVVAWLYATPEGPLPFDCFPEEEHT